MSIVLGFASSALAQDHPEASRGAGSAEDQNSFKHARALFGQATAAYGREDYARARALFAEAHAIEPGAATWRALGFCDFHLQQYVPAVTELRAALAEPRNSKALTAEQKRQVDELLRQIDPHVGHLTVVVQPEHATLELDGAAVADHDLWALPGSHTLTVRAFGHQPNTVAVTFDAGREQQLSVSLSPLPPRSASVAAVTPAEPVRSEPDAPAPSVARDDTRADPAAAGITRAVIGLSIGGAALIAGGVTGYISATKTADVKERCDQGHCPLDSRDALSRANTLANVSNISFAVAAVGVAYGIFELLTLPDAEPERAQASVRLDLTGTGVLLRGQW